MCSRQSKRLGWSALLKLLICCDCVELGRQDPWTYQDSPASLGSPVSNAQLLWLASDGQRRIQCLACIALEPLHDTSAAPEHHRCSSTNREGLYGVNTQPERRRTRHIMHVMFTLGAGGASNQHAIKQNDSSYAANARRLTTNAHCMAVLCADHWSMRHRCA
jgi:hypothetical protein